ncbi:hypothetical protein Tco_0794771 [Tanacetum coccineum]
MMTLARAISQQYSTPAIDLGFFRILIIKHMCKVAGLMCKARILEMLDMLATKKDEDGILLTHEENEFLLADFSNDEELDDLSSSCNGMARIQEVHTESATAPSYDFDVLNKVSDSETCFINKIFSVSDHEQSYPEQLETINTTYDDDQIDSNIIFDDSDIEVNKGNVKQHTSAYDQNRANKESLIRNVQLETEKTNEANKLVKKENALLSKELEKYKESVRVFLEKRKITYFEKEKHDLTLQVSRQKESISSLSQERDTLKENFKQREDKYLDEIIDLQNNIKDLDNIIYKTSQSIQTIHMLNHKPRPFYDGVHKYALEYKNPCFLKKAQAHNPKLYSVVSLYNNDVHAYVFDSEETLDDVEKSELKMKEIQKDENIQKLKIKSIDYNKLNHLFEDFDIQLCLWIFNSGCSKHMTGNLKLLNNFVEKFISTVKFGNDHFSVIMGFGDYVHENIKICHVYYVEGLRHNLFSVGQFCDGDLDVAFRSNTCYVRNLDGIDILTALVNRINLVAGLSKFKYDKDHMCSACEQGKSKLVDFKSKAVARTDERLHLLHMYLCGPLRVESVNGKKYILVILDDYVGISYLIT